MTKNMTKYKSYKYSSRRMNSAIKSGFFLEAVMIEESILSDRLLSVLIKSEIASLQSRAPFISFAKLIDLSAKLPRPFDRIDELHAWRIKRNKVAHAIAKSLPGEPTIATREFRRIAEDAAKDGRLLCNAVKKWSRLKQRQPS